jgi:hypothetical protein
MGMLLKKAQRHADAGPFLQPVSGADVPDYYTIIIVSLRLFRLRVPPVFPCCRCGGECAAGPSVTLASTSARECAAPGPLGRTACLRDALPGSPPPPPTHHLNTPTPRHLPADHPLPA